MYQEIKQMAQRALSRLNNVLGRGVLKGFTYGKRSKAQISLFDEEKYDDIEFAQDFGFMSYPPCDKNTELVVAFLRGQRDNGTVLRSFNRPLSPLANSNITLKEGECIYYNKVANCYIYLQQDGTITLKSQKKIENVVLNNLIKIDGDTGLVTIIGKDEVKVKIYDNDQTPFRTGTSTVGQALSQNKVIQVDLNKDGNIKIQTPNLVTIDSPNTCITGNLKVKGDMIDNTVTNTNNVRNMRTIYDNHVHPGVAVGAASTLQTTQTM